AAGALSRAASLPLAAALPYPRAEGGVLSGRMSPVAAVAAAVLAAGIALLVWWSTGVWLVVTAAALAALLGLWFSHWLGGAARGWLGAAAEVCERGGLRGARAPV